MSKAIRSLLVIALLGVGAVATASHPEWGKFRGAAAVLLLFAAVMAIGALSFRPRSDSVLAEKRASDKKVPKSLVTLSSAAILAIYAAGYHRTSSAEDKFADQTARRKAAVPFAAVPVVPEAVIPPNATPRGVSPSHLPPPLRADGPRPSAAAPKAAPVAIPGGNSPATPSAPPEATASVASSIAAPAAARKQYKDGTYLGWGRSRHGDIQAAVLIQGGQIVAADIAQCLTRYPCSWIVDLPGLVVSKQTPDVDFVSGATESSYAFSDAVADALSKASD